MGNRIFTDDIIKIVENAVKKEIEIEIDAAIKRIQNEIEYNIRRHTASIVANIFSQFDFIMNETNFVVRVNFDKKET
jgi:hypothetical protein